MAILPFLAKEKQEDSAPMPKLCPFISSVFPVPDPKAIHTGTPKFNGLVMPVPCQRENCQLWMIETPLMDEGCALMVIAKKDT